MDGKSTSVAVSEGAAQAVLRRGSVRELSAEEEKVMRMRLGATHPSRRRLEQVGRGLSDTEIELLAFEIEAYLKLKRMRSAKGSQRATPGSSRAKEKIVRALRKKK